MVGKKPREPFLKGQTVYIVIQEEGMEGGGGCGGGG